MEADSKQATFDGLRFPRMDAKALDVAAQKFQARLIKAYNDAFKTAIDAGFTTMDPAFKEWTDYFNKGVTDRSKAYETARKANNLDAMNAMARPDRVDNFFKQFAPPFQPALSRLPSVFTLNYNVSKPNRPKR